MSPDNLDAALPRFDEGRGPMLAKHVAVVECVVVMASY